MIPDTFAEHIAIHPWLDQVIDEHGFLPKSTYVEFFWLPVLGPSTIWLLRRLSEALDAAPDGFMLDVNECAAALGIAGSNGRNSAMQRTLKRMAQFSVAQAHDDHTMHVRRHLPPLNRQQVSRLPSSLRVAHDDWRTQELQLHTARKAAV